MKLSPKIVAITQARIGSTRLPGKVLKKIGNKTLLEIHLERALKSKKINQLVLATTNFEKDNAIADLGESIGISVYRGSETDVLDRYYQAAKIVDADIVVRITSDCPLIDSLEIDRLIEEHLKNNKDFTSNITPRTYPDGIDIEIFSMTALEKAWNQAIEMGDREHVTHYIWKNSDLMGKTLFTAHNVINNFGADYSDLRLTLDYPEDFSLFEFLIDKLGYDLPWIEYANYLNENPQIKKINYRV